MPQIQAPQLREGLQSGEVRDLVFPQVQVGEVHHVLQGFDVLICQPHALEAQLPFIGAVCFAGDGDGGDRRLLEGRAGKDTHGDDHRQHGRGDAAEEGGLFLHFGDGGVQLAAGSGRRRRGARYLHHPLGFDGLQELRGGLEPVLRLDGKTLQNGFVQVLRDVDAKLRDGDQFVLVQPLQALRREIPGDGGVEAGGAGVYVGVGALAAAADVLLFRGIAHFQDDVQALGLVANGVPGGAEVQELDHAVLGDVDVVRRHVTVDEALGVDGGERLEHRDHDVAGVLHADLAAVIGDIGLEGDALDVVHDEVRGVVFVEVAGHAGNVGMADELGQRAGFFLEPF